MDAFASFALDGLALPAFLIASGAAMVLSAPYLRTSSAEDLSLRHPVIRYLASRRWDRRAGLFMIFTGVFIAALRLAR